jgi:hypothetical protein
MYGRTCCYSPFHGRQSPSQSGWYVKLFFLTLFLVHIYAERVLLRIGGKSFRCTIQKGGELMYISDDGAMILDSTPDGFISKVC